METAMTAEQLILQAISRLETQVAEVAAAINSTDGKIGLAEGLRDARRECAALKAEVETLKTEVATLKANPGKIALTWFDRIVVAFAMIVITAIAGLVGAALQRGHVPGHT